MTARPGSTPVEDEGPACAVCGEAVEGDPDDEPYPDGSVICGACYRAREFDQMLWEREYL